jgi:hypothetical protein
VNLLLRGKSSEGHKKFSRHYKIFYPKYFAEKTLKDTNYFCLSEEIIIFSENSLPSPLTEKKYFPENSLPSPLTEKKYFFYPVKY